MRIDEIANKYPVLKDAIERIKEVDGVGNLFPPQEDAIKAGVLDGKSFVLAVSTGAGKTLIAELAMIKTILEGKKAIYLCPLKALASEKHLDLKEKYGPLGIKVALSIGDLDSSDPWLGRYDIVICSNEKADSLLRHGISWAGEIGLVVADEIHLLNDPSRGPTLEMVLTRLRGFNPVILGLSATIKNYKELASWLGAEAVKSNFRPVKLYKGVAYDNEVSFVPERKYTIGSENVLLELTGNKQSIVFISTRRGTEATAEKLGKPLSKNLSSGEREALLNTSKKILSSLEHRTQQCERLARCIQNGAAFHHAGLTQKQRSLVEDNFRAGVIKVVCATSTLAAGLNLPAYRVIIRDLKRFSSFRGMDYLPALEVEQISGRAGRIKYDTEGEAILLPKNQAEAEYAWKNYIHGETEKISSKLGVEPVLRTHVLALIAGGIVTSRQGLMDFFERTFYAYQYKDMSQLRSHLNRVVKMLEGFGFVNSRDKTESSEPESEFRPAFAWEDDDSSLEATRIGKRVSELYIDPLTADFIIRSFQRLQGPSMFTFLHMVSSCLEMRLSLSLRKKDVGNAEDVIAAEEHNLVEKPPNEWDLEYEDFLRSIKMASLLGAWAEENGEDYILENFGVTPGELKARLDIADWLLYSSQELGLLLGRRELLKELRKARLRVRYGVSEELLPLIRLKGIGRVRARRLFRAGIKSTRDLRKANPEALARLMGRATAEKIKEQLG